MTSTVPMASSRLVMRALRSGTPRAARPGAAGTNTIRAASCSTSAKASRSDSPQAFPFRLIETQPEMGPAAAGSRSPRSPTLEEAVVAAQGLSDDIEQQVEIASGLMGIPQEEVRPVIASAPPSETAGGFGRSSRAMPQVVVLSGEGRAEAPRDCG